MSAGTTDDHNPPKAVGYDANGEPLYAPRGIRFRERAAVTSRFAAHVKEVDCRAPGRSVNGPNPKTEVDMLLATHGWWPWALTYAFIIILIASVIVYFVKRRRAA